MGLACVSLTMEHLELVTGERFRDRQDAGRRLAAELRAHAAEHPVVLALPRGGVPVGFEVARALSAPFDVWVVRKVGVPWHPELGVGAVAEGGRVHLARDMIEYVGLSDEDLAKVVEAKRREVEERVRRFRGDRPRANLRDRTVIVVDDGIATGGTMQVVIESVRAEQPRKIVLAVPVAAAQTVAALAPTVDEVVCLLMPEDMFAISFWYEDFAQVDDDEVVRLLALARQQQAEPVSTMRLGELEQTLTIPAGEVELEGDLAIPPGALGLVLFAHGSGSSRKSTRNRFVARTLRERGIATLLFDLLTVDEERVDAIDAHLRFDIPLLADRLGTVTDWIRTFAPTRNLAVGYFGASTGAAAALIAAARRPYVSTVVSRGGRPDLAGDALAYVRAPTLLIVGGADRTVLTLNRQALDRMKAPVQLAIVPRATHLFEESGALEEVASIAADWLVEQFGSAAARVAGEAAQP